MSYPSSSFAYKLYSYCESLKLQSTTPTYITPAYTTPTYSNSILTCWLNSHSSSNTKCSCNEWYTWAYPNSATNLDCVLKKTPTEQCQDQYWEYATVWSTSDKCSCIKGYTLTGVFWKLTCASIEILKQGENIKNWMAACQKRFWDYSWGSWSDGLYSCYCMDWYIWNSNNTSCVEGTPSNNNVIKIDTNINSELQNAITWMYSNWLTSYSSVRDFMWDDYLTREQASKFFVQFGKKIFGKIVNDTKPVKLNDILKANTTLQSYIKEANQLWLFKGVNGMFLPFNKLTQAQTIAVLIRTNNWLQNEINKPWYSNYYNIANNYWILQWLWFDFNSLDSNNIKRKEVALLLFRLSNYISQDNSSVKLCQKQYGEFSNSDWISDNSWSYLCTCKQGYTRNNEKTQCITPEAYRGSWDISCNNPQIILACVLWTACPEKCNN